MSHVINHTSAEEFFSMNILEQSALLLKAMGMGNIHNRENYDMFTFFGCGNNVEFLDELEQCLPTPGAKKTVLENLSKRLHEVLGGAGDSDIVVQSFFPKDVHNEKDCFMQVVDLNPLNQRSTLLRVRYLTGFDSQKNFSMAMEVTANLERPSSNYSNIVFTQTSPVDNDNEF